MGGSPSSGHSVPSSIRTQSVPSPSHVSLVAHEGARLSSMRAASKPAT